MRVKKKVYASFVRIWSKCQDISLDVEYTNIKIILKLIIDCLPHLFELFVRITGEKILPEDKLSASDGYVLQSR